MCIDSLACNGLRFGENDVKGGGGGSEIPNGGFIASLNKISFNYFCVTSIFYGILNLVLNRLELLEVFLSMSVVNISIIAVFQGVNKVITLYSRLAFGLHPNQIFRTNGRTMDPCCPE